jgi:deazaflavin-dependent oxidoreductase (nitroreductase family)
MRAKGEVPPPGAKLVASGMDTINEHLQLYLKDGREGHLQDLRDAGGYNFSPTLLIRMIGRKSGKPHVLPLLYGLFSDEVIIVGSKGGHPDHPAWFYNLTAGGDVTLQIVEDCFRASWRVLEGEEYANVWDYMIGIYPPFAGYQKVTERQIPLVALKRIEQVEQL